MEARVRKWAYRFRSTLQTVEDVRFTEAEARQIQELIGLPAVLASDAVAARTSVPLKDLRQVLPDLAEPRHREWLGPRSWLAGGAVLRWVCRERGLASRRTTDYDFYFPSAGALDETARALLAAGLRFRCFRSRRPMCQLCGLEGEVVPGGTMQTEFLPVRRIRCRTCGEFGGADAASLTPDRLLRLTPDLIARNGIFALELTTEDGGMVHLAAIALRPTPFAVVANFDFSVVQFGLDGENLHFGPHAWTDLLLGRLRLEVSNDGLENYQRLKKYASQGFRPYAETVARVLYHRLRPEVA